MFEIPLPVMVFESYIHAQHLLMLEWSPRVKRVCMFVSNIHTHTVVGLIKRQFERICNSQKPSACDWYTFNLLWKPMKIHVIECVCLLQNPRPVMKMKFKFSNINSHFSIKTDTLVYVCLSSEMVRAQKCFKTIFWRLQKPDMFGLPSVYVCLRHTCIWNK